jgi:serine protease Do
MIKNIGVMLVLSIIISLVSVAVIVPAQYNSNSPIYISGYIAGYAIGLVAISYIIALIPRLLYFTLKKKRVPDFSILAWSVWIILATILLASQINRNLTRTEVKPTVASKIFNTTANKVYQSVEKSVYMIYNEGKDNQPIASGSAVAVTKDFLATNCHVIEDGDHFNIAINGKNEPGKLYSEHGDLCIISVPNSTFTPVDLRFSKEVSIGEEVFAVGNPKGLEKSISRGIISNKFNDEGITILQTDAAISHGSSGGGLFDRNGKLIGITTAKPTDSEGIGLVISTEVITAALLEPRIETKKETKEDSERTPQETNNKVTPKEAILTAIGYYGDNEVGLLKYGDICFMAIQGRSKEYKPRSLIFWTPSDANKFFIFPLTITPKDALKILISYFNDKYELSLTKNYLAVDEAPYQLSGEINGSNSYRILTASIDINPIKNFIDGEYFIVQFTDKSSDTGYSNDYFGLNGFSEALTEYHDHCDNTVSSNTSSTTTLNNTNNDSANNIVPIGYYGNSKIELVKYNNVCFITIPGRYRPTNQTSLALWYPGAPNGLFIFSKMTTTDEVFEFISMMNKTDNTKQVKSKSFIFFDKIPYPLTLMSINNINYPVYVFKKNNDITESLVNLDNFLGQFYNYGSKPGMTSIKFSLDGFTEALAAYHDNCDEK